MKIINTKEFKELIDKNPGVKFAFYEYKPDVLISRLHILDGNTKYPYFGATTFESYDDHDSVIFNYDFNLGEYSDDEQFVVLDNLDLKDIRELLKKAQGVTDE